MNTSQDSLFGYSARRRGDTYQSNLPDPYVMYSTTQMPDSISDVLKLCEHIWLNSGQYKMAMQRISRYFLTKVAFEDGGDKEKDRYVEFFNSTLNVMTLLAEVADDYACYGNSFTSLYMPFNRILFCDECSFSSSIDNIKDDDISLDMKTLKFKAKCPRCAKKTPHTHKDLRSQDQERIHIIRWNPHEIDLLHNFMSGETDYIWKISSDIKTNIKKSIPFWIKHMPWEVIEAVSKGSSFRFNPGVVYHMKEPVIAGVQNRGWGIPRMLAAYKDIYYIQILKRYNEALALDYIVPFRVLTPAKATSADPLMQYDMSGWTRNIEEMIHKHRKDPAGWHSMPFPINYQVLSGEGVKLSPFQLIKQGTADMNDSLGVPIEMFQGSMSIQAAPMAMRMFESQWPHLQAVLNGWLHWLMANLSTAFGWEKATAKLQPPTFADDLERKQILFQMASANQISKETGFSPLGIDPQAEQERMMEENRAQIDSQREFEEQEAKKQELKETISGMAAQAAGAMGPGQGQVDPAAGMPMDPAVAAQAQGGAGGGMVQPMGGMPGMTMPGQGMGATTPQELMQQAEQMASELMAMPETNRKSQLISLKKNNPVLHAQVKQIMENMTQEAATQGVSQMRQSMQQGGGM